MKIQNLDTEYIFSGPTGDMPADREKLKSFLPFSLGDFDEAAGRSASGICYGEYFNCISDFLSENSWSRLLCGLARHTGSVVSLSDIARLVIRSEKHGAMYHIASIQAKLNGFSYKLAITTAISDEGTRLIEQDFHLLSALGRRFPYNYLPAVYLLDQGTLFDNSGTELRPTIMLGEWLDDYHEFHLSYGEAKEQQVILWDYSRGNRFLSRSESFELFREIAKALTLYYDSRTFAQISGWHNAAGDFIVSAPGNKVQVKLITVRRYEPLVPTENKGISDSLAALLHFLLLMCIKIRLDRIDGIGEPAWAEAYCLEAAVAGFVDALKLKEKTGELFFSAAEFIKSLKELDPADLQELVLAALQTCSWPASDMPLLVAHIEQHLQELLYEIKRI